MHPYVNFLENISCWFLCLKIAEMFEQSLGKINRFAIVIERQIFIIARCNGTLTPDEFALRVSTYLATTGEDETPDNKADENQT